ncbi:hypothetical protein CLOSYM_04884, partial [[Clostridium] symbiosum ATCC 14940]
KNRSAEDRTAAGWNYVATATRRRRRIPLAGFFLVQQERLLLNKNRSAEDRTACSGV